ncbi:MAG: carbon-nitrogen hydrolase [Armatimonadetes bacterium]|nr:carbon-nitrogen hydrolase [Armatimonadota bacterium]
MKITLAQIAPGLGRVEENLARHRELIAAAWAEGVDLLVFPELSVTGYLLRDDTARVARSTEQLIGELRGIAPGDKPLDVVLGFIELSAGRQCYNAAVYLRYEPGQATPVLVHRHRKVHLPTYGMFDERRYVNPGQRLAAFDSPVLGRAGLLVCEDLWHPATVYTLSVDGPGFEGMGVLLGIANSPARGVDNTEGFTTANLETWRRLNRLYAEIFGVLVVHVQRVGVEDQYIFTGGSEIVTPSGDTLLAAPLFDEAILSVEIDTELWLRAHRASSPRALGESVHVVRRELERIGSEVYR